LFHLWRVEGSFKDINYLDRGVHGVRFHFDRLGDNISTEVAHSCEKIFELISRRYRFDWPYQICMDSLKRSCSSNFLDRFSVGSSLVISLRCLFRKLHNVVWYVILGILGGFSEY
jgi:hypothetical protein